VILALQADNPSGTIPQRFAEPPVLGITSSTKRLCALSMPPRRAGLVGGVSPEFANKGFHVTDSMVRLAVVGLGHWGKNVVRSFAGASHCHLAYLCDTDARRLERHRSLSPQATVTRDYEAVLRDPGVDAVALVTPAPCHYEMAKSALRAGKHVYVEKPLALSSRHAEELVETAEAGGRKLMVGHLLEYHPAVALMKAQVESGRLGDIYYVYCQRLNLGVVRQNENAFWSLAAHDISVILYLFDQEPDRVAASGACFLQEGIEDLVFDNLHFPDGRIAQIHVSWLDPHKERRMVVVGSKKMLVFDDMHPSEKIRIFDKGASFCCTGPSELQAISIRHGDILIPHVSGQAPLDIETQHFIDCVRNDTAPRSDGVDGLRVVRILEEVEWQLHRNRRTDAHCRVPAQVVAKAA
jgi:predicted dehydrogenase